LVTSMLTLDIKKAFDTVLPGRLVRRLRLPVSPILFILYIKPLFKLGTASPGRKQSRFGYANNVAILLSLILLKNNYNILTKE
ncbi:hypothetical protein BDP81DRAFT_336994, partial [Colletotrichum phormii]